MRTRKTCLVGGGNKTGYLMEDQQKVLERGKKWLFSPCQEKKLREELEEEENDDDEDSNEQEFEKEERKG